MLITIAIAAILFAMLSPVLAGVRGRTMRSRATATLAENVRAFTVYTNDYKGVWPYLTEPRASWTILRGEGIEVPTRYFDVLTHWHIVLAEPYFGLKWSHARFGDTGRGHIVTTAWYAPTFFAHPDYFRRESRVGPGQWTPTAVSDVQFPSSKGVFLNFDMWVRSGSGPDRIAILAFADGSATIMDQEATIPGYPVAMPQFPQATDFLDFAPPGMMTVDGVRGRDR
jgi:hypothetical protein